MTLAASHAWEKADPLWSAVEKYSPAELWNRFVELGGPSQEIFAPSDFITPPLRDGTTPRSGSPLGVIEERLILLNEIRWAFIHMLSESKLSGVGYKLPRRRGDKPEWISSEYWKEGKTDWDRSELHCAHCSYQDVRIVPSRGIRDEARRTFMASLKESGRSAKGPSTRKPQIISAWDALVAEGKIPKMGTLKSIFGLVREKVHKMFGREKPDDEGLGDKVLYRELSPLWKAHREANPRIP